MNLSRRTFLRFGTTVLVAAATGCDQVPESFWQGLPGQPVRSGPFQPPATDSIDLITHALNRLTFGPRPGDYARVKALVPDPAEAVSLYIAEQLEPERIDDAECEYALRRFDSLWEPVGELFEYQARVLLEEQTRATLLRATFSKRQLHEVMVQFWSDHFNIDSSKGDCKWLKAADDRDVIRRHALGKFPELLRASALSPAMLWYLDGRVNRKESAADRPNENYARELLELHTLGVHGGYTQRDVMEVARCLTGWTVRAKNQSNFQIGKVEFKPALHDDGDKEILGYRIPAGFGERDLDRVLEIVALHPSTARHLATKLCRRFIADDPPAPAITTVADAFLKSAGDICATLRVLFATAEFREARGAKFKRPFNYIVSTLRATDARTDADPVLVEYLQRMGHAPFQYPTPDGYAEHAAPWLGTLLWRWNFALTLSANRLNGTKLDLPALTRNCGGDEGLMAHFLGRQPTAEEVQSYHNSGRGLALLLASPGFQRC